MILVTQVPFAAITVGSTALALLLGLPAAYARSPYRTKRTDGGRLWMNRVVPPAGGIVPIFVLLHRMNLLDTHLGLITLLAGMDLPLVTWMGAGCMDDLPFALIEAGAVDVEPLASQVVPHADFAEGLRLAEEDPGRMKVQYAMGAEG